MELVGADEHRLLPFMERIEGNRLTVSVTQVRQALRSVASRKPPGPGGLPVEFYRKIPAILPTLAGLLNLVCAGGTVRKRLRRVYLEPLSKPGTDPHHAESQLPGRLKR